MIDENELELQYLRERSNFLPWEEKDETTKLEFDAYKNVLKRRAGATIFGPNCFVSPKAHVYTHRFEIGSNSWIAAGVILRGDVRLGDNTTINPFAHIAGKVRIGNGVRIAGLASIYGFNHGFSQTDRPIYVQKHTSEGVIIMDDIWIGANAVIVDGVTIGSHSIVAGGAVVTKDVPEYSIIAGNPGRLLKNRLDLI